MSQSLHHWIDLNFGHALRGDAAVVNLNVELPRLGPGPLRRRRRPQLFDSPHPRRLPGTAVAGNQPVLVRPCWRRSWRSLHDLTRPATTRCHLKCISAQDSVLTCICICRHRLPAAALLSC